MVKKITVFFLIAWLSTATIVTGSIDLGKIETVLAVKSDVGVPPPPAKKTSPKKKSAPAEAPQGFQNVTTFPDSQASSTKSVPDTFSVSEYLTTEGQKSSVPNGKNDNGEEKKGAIGFLINLIDLLVKFIGFVALVVFMLGALLTITSEGKEDRLEKGKTAMVYAIIGLLIAFFSFIIVAFVQSVLF